jgi:hypothetical protein
MQRSTCVVCKKKRLHKYMKQFTNLDGSYSWLCNNLKEFNYIKIGSFNYNYNPCQMSFLLQQFETINNHIKNHVAAKKSLWYYDKIIQEKNVSSGLTFLLQYENQNPD